MLRRAALLVVFMSSLLQGAGAFAQGWQRPMSPEERRGLRQDIDYMRRDPGGRPQRSPEEVEARREERSRLRDAIRDGRMTREEAIEHYRGRFGGPPPPPGGQMTPDEREKLRRDLIDANRERGRR